MLREVAPHIASLKLDIPLKVEIGGSPVRPFSRLELLVLDVRDTSMWAPIAVDSTLRALHAEHVREVHFTNANKTVVAKCMDLVRRAAVCIVIHDGDTGHIGFVDQRGYERHASGAFINSTPFLYTPDFFASIKHLALSGSISHLEMPLLFSSFPRDLQDLTIWFGDESSVRGCLIPVLEWRSSGGGCCAQLSSLRLTTAWPLKGPRARRADPPRLSISTVRGFLDYIHGRDAGHVQIILDGVELKHTSGPLYPLHIS
ncbi:hypothetical protein AURDEDRAFT_111813 [Auricularia subglabra TFB-10046 SS5]|nr:hypothetical protein AURDEDRAFT_111813 [Auricularia subglabra TFB-10046 SS5]